MITYARTHLDVVHHPAKTASDARTSLTGLILINSPSMLVCASEPLYGRLKRIIQMLGRSYLILISSSIYDMVLRI